MSKTYFVVRANGEYHENKRDGIHWVSAKNEQEATTKARKQYGQSVRVEIDPAHMYE